MSKLMRSVSWFITVLVVSAPAVAVPAASVQPPSVHARLQHPPPPRQWQQRPPSAMLSRYGLHDSRVVIGKPAKPLRAKALTPQCQDLAAMAALEAPALADYLVRLPDSACTYGLFSLRPDRASQLYTAEKLALVAQRFALESLSYNASNLALVNLTLYLRAAYYLAAQGSLAAPDPGLRAQLRPSLRHLLTGSVLFAPNSQDSSSGAEVLRLISNLHDESSFLPELTALVRRYTNSQTAPGAAQALRESSASQGFTGVLTAFYYAHFRPEAQSLLQSDPRYATALFDFVMANKSQLSGTETAYQLGDAARESLRFLQYPALKDRVKQQAQSLLAVSNMTGPDDELWLAVAGAVKYYDAENCADYATCNFETRLADVVLGQRYNCSPTIRIRAQQMTAEQMQMSCGLMQQEESLFHQLLKTQRQPVAGDLNASLEVIVFDDYNNYSKYASLIYGIRTDNGGMYEEGSPSLSGNQARFIAHEASWLRPVFSVWNLEHEYVHYLDGRFDMQGDFVQSTSQPTVWWIEGLAEYVSLRNNNQAAIDLTRGGGYRLSQIFGNSYAMSDYVPRAYRWGYMATRFMFEKHRNDVDAILQRFRQGDYSAYGRMMNQIGTGYDAEFARWLQTATTAGQPPIPDNVLPECPATSGTVLGNNCSIYGLTSASAAYVTLRLPPGASNLKVWTQGGVGDLDLYLALDRYPTPASYDLASISAGNQEAISVPVPQTGRWYYLTLKARSPFSGVSISASFD